jgi:hypothetical protein
MFHPDQRYDVRLLQQQDLQMEAARLRLATQAGEQSNDRLARIGATARTLTRRVGGWLRLGLISRARTSKG